MDIDTVLVTPQWVHEHLTDPEIRLIDATHFYRDRLPPDRTLYPESLTSGHDAYLRAHIPGAVFYDLAGQFSREDTEVPLQALDSEDFAARIGALGIGDDARVVVYDHGENEWATRVRWNLMLEGFEAVHVLDGGLPAWVGAGYGTTSGEESYPAATFTARRRPELYASKEDVRAALDDPDTVIVDALPEEVHNGTAHWYARAGHIPGSVNVPFTSLQDDDQLALPEDDARARFESSGVELDPSKTYIAQCGAGIAATYAAFHLNRLGLQKVRVYDGSLSEWTADPDLPMTNPADDS